MYKSTSRLLTGAVAVIGVAVTAGTAFTASNTIADQSAGQGVAPVSGYTITDVEYITDIDGAANNTNASTVVEVQFDIVRDVTTLYATVADVNARVFVHLRSDTATDGNWATCTVTAGQATCALTGAQRVLIDDVDDISVVAYDIDPTP